MKLNLQGMIMGVLVWLGGNSSFSLICLEKAEN